MKVGSLVVCIEKCETQGVWTMLGGITILPDEHTIYTIRDIIPKHSGKNFIYTVDCVRLVEIINPVSPNAKMEMAYDISCFREIQPPMDLSELIEETKIKEIKTPKLC